MKTLEELKAANAERQSRWRKRHPWVHRKRIEEGRKPQIVTNNVIGNVTPPPEPAKEDPNERVLDEEYTYEENPEDARTATEKKQDEEQQQARARRAGMVKPAATEAVSAAMGLEIGVVQEWAKRRKRSRDVRVELKGVEVEGV